MGALKRSAEPPKSAPSAADLETVKIRRKSRTGFPMTVPDLHFLPDGLRALHAIRSVLKAGGLLATTQPRHRGAKVDDAQAFAEMIQAGFREVSVKQYTSSPLLQHV